MPSGRNGPRRSLGSRPGEEVLFPRHRLPGRALGRELGKHKQLVLAEHLSHVPDKSGSKQTQGDPQGLSTTKFSPSQLKCAHEAPGNAVKMQVLFGSV